MPVRSFQLASIEGKRYAKQGERFRNVRVDHNSTITNVAAREPEGTEIEFRFTVTYSGIGVIKMEGNLHIEGARDVARTWSETGNLPEEVASEVHTAIVSYGIQEAVILARELRLPPPIPLPRIQVNKGGKKSTGMEVA